MENSIEVYQPAPSDIKQGRVRQIYLLVPLEPDEEEAIEVFRKYLASNNISYPDWIFGEERWGLKFMDSMKRDPKKAAEFMMTYLNWLPTLPVPENEVIRHLQAGLIYVSGRSMKFNPVIVVNVRKIIDSRIDLESLLRLNYFIYNWVIQNLIVPGKAETWIILQDLEGVGVTDVPAKLLKTMSERLSVYFSLRLCKCITLNAPFTIGAIWSIVKVFIDEETRKKIIIERKGWRKILEQLITPNNLEVKYGGTQPNRESFYPFF